MQEVHVKLTQELPWQKVAFNKKTSVASKLDLNLRRKVIKRYIWSIALYGSEKWTFWRVDQKYLKSLEMLSWRRKEKIRWTDRVKNEAVLHTAKEEGNILRMLRRRNCN
jgi:hypothetical protein